jgi:cytochrome c553
VERRKVPVVVALAAALAADAIALDIAPNTARDLAAGCNSCHRTGGAGGIADLTGMPPQALIASMQAYRSGARPGTVMPQLARGYTDPEIEAIAAWYAAQKAIP